VERAGRFLARILEDHILRRLNAVLNLDFVREEVASKYGRNGQASVDSVVLMKMMLLLFLDDVKSEREREGVRHCFLTSARGSMRHFSRTRQRSCGETPEQTIHKASS
jgi:hypothetical protein